MSVVQTYSVCAASLWLEVHRKRQCFTYRLSHNVDQLRFDRILEFSLWDKHILVISRSSRWFSNGMNKVTEQPLNITEVEGLWWYQTGSKQIMQNEDDTERIALSSRGPWIVSKTSTVPPAWTNASIVRTGELVSKSSKKPIATWLSSVARILKYDS